MKLKGVALFWCKLKDIKGSFLRITVLVFILVMAGCGDDSPKNSDGVSAHSQPLNTAAEASKGGMAVVALAGDPDVLNPLIRRSVIAGAVLAEILDTLTEMSEDFTYEPRIAESWELAPDSLSITYHLKPWQWEDGTPLTAEDVAISFELFRNSEVASPSRSLFSDVVRAEVIDSRTLKYHFNRIFPDPLSRTGHSILPKHVVSNLDPSQVNQWDINQHPVSSGPFRFQSWDHSRELVLTRNEAYPLEHAMLDRVSFRIIQESAARVLSLEAGEVDFVSGISTSDAKRLAQRDDLKIMPVGGRRFYYLMWNCRNPRFTDALTRRALSHAIDRDRMINTLLDGYAEPAVGPVAQVVWNYSKELKADAYDPEGCKSLLEEAGWHDNNGDGILERDGNDLEFEILTRQSDPIRSEGVVIIRENFRDIGAKVSIRSLELASGLALLRKGDYDAYFGAMNPNLYGDPTGTVHSASIDAFNNGFYSNSKVDSLLEVALAIPDRVEAQPVWNQLQLELQRDPPSAYLFCPMRLDVVSTRIRNVRSHVLSPYNNLMEWWIAPEDRKYRLK